MGILSFILDKDHNPVPLDFTDDNNAALFSLWMADIRNRRVGESFVNGCRISTVFLGFDHNFAEQDEPILFETMIFTRRKGSYRKFHTYQWRYRTWNEAKAGHDAVSHLVKSKALTKLRYL